MNCSYCSSTHAANSNKMSYLFKDYVVYTTCVTTPHIPKGGDGRNKDTLPYPYRPQLSLKRYGHGARHAPLPSPRRHRRGRRPAHGHATVAEAPALGGHAHPGAREPARGRRVAERGGNRGGGGITILTQSSIIPHIRTYLSRLLARENREWREGKAACLHLVSFPSGFLPLPVGTLTLP